MLSELNKPMAPIAGYLNLLPIELLEKVLSYCGAQQLGALETTCTYFIQSQLTNRAALARLQLIARAKGLQPDTEKGETWTRLLHFVASQSAAAAQGTAVALGSFHTTALLIPEGETEHSLHAFGRGFHGQLGNGKFVDCPEPTSVAEARRAVNQEKGHPAVVTCGSSHSGLISRRGELFTWGLASSGELGHGGWTPIEVQIPRQVVCLERTRIVSVAAGANHTLAISERGELWSCGRGRHGQLGLGHFHDEGVLLRIDRLIGQRIVSAAAGKAHSLALASDGSLWTWGDGRHGQLGHEQLAQFMALHNNPPVAVPVPQKVKSLLPDKLKPFDRVTAVAAGAHHSMALTVGGKLLAFGANKYGALGLGDKDRRLVPTEVPLADSSGSRSKVRAVQVQCGQQHSLALVQKDGCLQVCATGYNVWGQLGTGDRQDSLRFKVVRSLLGHPIAALVSGDSHAAAITRSGELYMWGRGDCGQLGVQDSRSYWQPKLLQGFRVVHPDRTLRRNGRTCSP
ncbi:hypothetical protein WJX72_005277 [[Myrmecia] bisecta]|uniref:RCC1-like domain-containing protein n=1 Tax=[Myrmecia] bisecta TaxID=41462 RepID=A0AAW1PB42_9CHLO